MTIIRNVAVSATIAACAFSAATVSAADRTDRRESVVARVTRADLDLGKAGDRDRLAQRIARAARRACGLGSTRGTATMDAARCYREMLADGNSQLAAIERRGSVQVAVR